MASSKTTDAGTTTTGTTPPPRAKAPSRRRPSRGATTSTEPQPSGTPVGGTVEGDPTAPATAPAKVSAKTGSAPRNTAVDPAWAKQGDALTTSQGQRVEDTDNSLRAGRRGPSLLEDHHVREKITHFDHERIPERVVHARGAGAHGHFELFESLESVTSARVLTEVGVSTPVFT